MNPTAPASGRLSTRVLGLSVRGLIAAAALALTAHTVRADPYDDLRLKWRDMMTGGTGYNTSDPDIAARITSITNTANSYWNSMVKTGGLSRTYLWSDLTSTTVSSQVTTAYNRLRSMALAYGTYGSSLAGNTTLRDDIIGALDWMNSQRYTATTTEYDNWWDWEIGAPLALNDTMVLVYDGLTGQQANYCAAIDHFTPTPNMTAANLAWKCMIVGLRGIIGKTDTKIAAGRDGLNGLFATSHGDGVHGDGSFIQHNAHPYTGGYGLPQLQMAGNLIALLKGSAWQVTNPQQVNAYQWIYSVYAPFIYKGGMMSSVRGREISRSGSQDHASGQKAMEYILRWMDLAPANDVATYKQMIKYWMQQDTFRSFIGTIGTIEALQKAQAIRDDASILPMAEPVMNAPFPEMDRIVHLRPGFGFAISMHSSRIYDYESINGENVHGWHTGSGMTYLYNGDLAHYDQDYWATVNPYRLPGTTVDTQTLADGANQSKKSTESWVGGAEIDGLYGIAGMSLKAQGNTLAAKKSWFMFDDEIVALGSGITSTDSRTIETIIENRRITNANALTVDNVAEPTTAPWSATLTPTWMHLAGSNAGADIGYYFPTPTTINALREDRTGNWDSIGTGSATAITRSYVTFWFDHGANPLNASYAYVLLPNKTAAQVSAYASAPDITILENSTAAQGVKENKLAIVGVNFWQDAVKTVDLVTSDKKAAVLTRETPGQELEVSVADPTQLASTINIEIARSASAVIAADSRITVTQLSPTIKFSVNVYAGAATSDTGNGIRGHAWKAKFDLAPAKTPTSTFGWFNQSLLDQAGTFTAEFDATPSASPLNAVVGFSNNPALAYTAVAAALRFNPSGAIDARNGSAYAAVTAMPFAANTTYHVRMVVNVPAHTYSAYVTAPGGTEQTIASNYAFRTEQAAVALLNNLAVDVDASIAGSVRLAGLVTSVAVNSGASFVNAATDSQAGTFTATFDATPSGAALDAVAGFSAGSAAAYTDLAAAVRFNSSGMIDARNGAAYQATQSITYSAGQTYHFRVVANVATHTYSAYVTPPDDTERPVALDYAFRTEQAGVGALANFAANVNATTAGTVVVSRLVVRDSALRLSLPFDDTGTIATDDSRSGNNGTAVNGALWTAGPRGGGIDLDGINDYVSLPAGMADFRSGLTITFWAYPASVKNNARFVDFGNSSVNSNIIIARNGTTNDLAVWVNNGTTAGPKVTATGALALSQWQRFAITIDGSGAVTIYKNGTVVGSGTTNVPGNVSRAFNFIGRSNTNTDAYYDGALDDLRVYARALSSAEVQALR